MHARLVYVSWFFHNVVTSQLTCISLSSTSFGVAPDDKKNFASSRALVVGTTLVMPLIAALVLV